MRNRHRLAIGVAVALSIGLLARLAVAQAPAPPFNPPVANCNTTPDTVPDPNDPSKAHRNADRREAC